MLKRKRDRIAVEEFCKRIRNNLGKEVKGDKALRFQSHNERRNEEIKGGVIVESP